MAVSIPVRLAAVGIGETGYVRGSYMNVPALPFAPAA